MILELTAQIVAAHVANNTVSVEELPKLIDDVHRSLVSVAEPAPQPKEGLTPAVPTKESITRERIACLECGSKHKMLRRHLGSAHGLTPGQYRDRWGLPSDYPMTAPAYSEVRSGLAKSLGLGRVRSTAEE